MADDKTKCVYEKMCRKLPHPDMIAIKAKQTGEALHGFIISTNDEPLDEGKAKQVVDIIVDAWLHLPGQCCPVDCPDRTTRW